MPGVGLAGRRRNHHARHRLISAEAEWSNEGIVAEPSRNPLSTEQDADARDPVRDDADDSLPAFATASVDGPQDVPLAAE